VSAERTHTELKFTRDPRLLAGVRAAVQFVAARGGMSEADGASLAEASEKAACGALKKLTGSQSSCSVAIAEFDDRIEIRIERPTKLESVHPGNSSAMKSSGEIAEEQSALAALRCVDRVLYDARNGKSSTTLVKFFSKKPAAH
jgi:hypothetical protein